MAGGGGISASGFVDGVGEVARFTDPKGITFLASGDLVIADTINNLIRKITSTGSHHSLICLLSSFFFFCNMGVNEGVVSTLAGGGGGTLTGFVDGVGAEARFTSPSGITALSSGDLVIADTNNNIIRLMTSTGTIHI